MKRKLYILLAVLVLSGLTAMAQMPRGSGLKTPPKTEQTQKKEGTTTKSNKGGSKKNNQQSAAEKQRRQQEEAERQRLAEEQRRQQEEAKRQRAEAEELRRQQEELAQQRAAFEEQRRQQEDAERMRIIQQAIDDMVYVEGGTFKMGATKEQGRDAGSDEKPTHQVTLSSFYISKYEVTQELWQAVMGKNPSEFKGDLRRPVEQVSWRDCQEFISKLNELTGKRFRLPTEAEWEYAARGGNQSRGYKYSGSKDPGSVAWYSDNSGRTTHPVGQKSPNALGLYDMSGNVFEWCQDCHRWYSKDPQTNPTGPESGSDRVLRGGGWKLYAEWCRVSCRSLGSPMDRSDDLGLRLAL